MNPPLRAQSDQEALIEGLLDGTLDFIATDHAPHTQAEKAQGFMKAPFGIVGIETSFALMYTHLVQAGLMTLEELIQRMGQVPAQLFKLPYSKVQVGSVADIAVFDLKQSYTINP